MMEEGHRAIARFFVEALVPFKAAENPAFINMIRVLQRKYKCVKGKTYKAYSAKDYAGKRKKGMRAVCSCMSC
jgi:hypothetical protein